MPQAGAPACAPYPPGSTAPAMAFVKEVPSDEALERYGSLLNLRHSRLWVADHERQIFLWGGQTGNPYFDDLIEGVFVILYEGRIFKFYLYCRQWQLPFEDGFWVLRWDSINDIDPTPGKVGVDVLDLMNEIKGALVVLGTDALYLGSRGPTKVLFGF